MAERCLLYYITDRKAFPGNEMDRRERLLAKVHEAVLANVDFIQLREKDLPSRELELLARAAASLIANVRNSNAERVTKLLINSRADVALAVEADGIHLRSDDISVTEAKEIWQKHERYTSAHFSPKLPVVGVSCHSPEEVAIAEAAGASFAVFAPVFEKKDSPGVPAKGLLSLQKASKASLPVLALGGVTLANARSCIEAGASGIAAIRLFQENDIASVVRGLRP